MNKFLAEYETGNGNNNKNSEYEEHSQVKNLQVDLNFVTVCNMQTTNSLPCIFCSFELASYVRINKLEVDQLKRVFIDYCIFETMM